MTIARARLVYVSIALAGLVFVRLQAAATSPQQADVFSSKIAQIQQQGSAKKGAAPIRTALTQDELNSWFAYRGQPRMPAGVTQVQLTMLGQGHVSGQAIVDLEQVGKRRATGGVFDPWAYIGGRVPVTLTGILQTQNGLASFQVEQADISGVPVPESLLQELMSFYSKSPRRPEGVRLGDTFELPANIRHIEVGQGRAVVVQ